MLLPARPSGSPASRAAELRPDNPQYGYTYAFFLNRAGKLNQALEALHRVRERHPSDQDSALLERQLLQEQARKRDGSQGR